LIEYSSANFANIIGVKIGNKWGLIIYKSERKVLTPRYDVVGRFLGGQAEVSIDYKWVYVDMRGQEVVTLCYDYAGRFVTASKGEFQ
jgi:hypothetical protein